MHLKLCWDVHKLNKLTRQTLTRSPTLLFGNLAPRMWLAGKLDEDASVVCSGLAPRMWLACKLVEDASVVCSGFLPCDCAAVFHTFAADTTSCINVAAIERNVSYHMLSCILKRVQQTPL